MIFLDICSGIGGFRRGLEQVGFTCFGHIEIDKLANKSYSLIHNIKEGEYFERDISKITDESFKNIRGKVDIICAGFPCQPFSIAGCGWGFNDTRGTIFFEVVRAISNIKPKYFILENVKNILGHDNGKTFTTILKSLSELGYCVEWKVLNSKDFGLPQSRERVYIVGYCEKRRYKRPILINIPRNGICNNKLKIIGEYTNPNRDVGRRIYDIKGLYPTITTKNYKSDAQKIYYQYKNLDIVRLLTAKERMLIQGFTEYDYYNLKENNITDTRICIQTGNAVSVNIVREIGEEIKSREER